MAKKVKRAAPRKAARKMVRPKRKPIMRHSREGVSRASKAKKAAGGNAAKRSASAAKRDYLDRFATEFPTTLKIMRAIPAGQEGFKPHDRSQSAVRLLHTFSFENFGAAAALEGELEIPPKFPGPPATLAEAIDNYERGAKELIEAVRAVRDSRLHEEIMFFTGPGKMGKKSVIEVLWLMLLDSIHHRGQLSVYVRLAGGKVPSIYGPTADEPWR